MDEIVFECNEQMGKLLDAFVNTGLFGPTRDTAAQRLLELKLYEMMLQQIDRDAGKKK